MTIPPEAHLATIVPMASKLVIIVRCCTRMTVNTTIVAVLLGPGHAKTLTRFVYFPVPVVIQSVW